MQEYRRRVKFIIFGLVILGAAITAAILIIGVMKVISAADGEDEIPIEDIRVFDPPRARFLRTPIIKQDDVVLVPFKRIFESFGAVITWNEQAETTRASNAKTGFVVSLKIGDSKAILNGVETDISVPAQIIDDIIYVPFDLIRHIPGIVISPDVNKTHLKVWSADIFIRLHGWTQLCDGLIVHAGGGLYKDEGDEQIPQIYTNSREAMENSYSNGHRVFEIDFLLTSDGKLAAVHDWERVGGRKSSEEWKDVKIDGMYKALFLEDIYEFMLEYPDTFLVTDTKSFFNDRATNIKQVEQLVNTAGEMDKSLLKRIIPQVYDQDCYKILMGVYAFDSVIYTLYESNDTPDEVADFVAECPNIKVITMMWTQLTDDFYKALTRLSKYVYFFTINIPRQAEMFRLWGVRGFYTDFINPKLAAPRTPAAAPKNNPITVIAKVLKKIYIMFTPASLVQIFVVLFVFNLKLIQGFVLLLISAFLYKNR